MADKRAPFTMTPKNGYRFAGIVFLVAGIIFIFTSTSALWISMFVLGVVFITLSITLGNKTADDTDSVTDDPRQ